MAASSQTILSMQTQLLPFEEQLQIPSPPHYWKLCFKILEIKCTARQKNISFNKQISNRRYNNRNLGSSLISSIDKIRIW